MKGWKHIPIFLPERGVVVTDIAIENGRIAAIGDDLGDIEPLTDSFCGTLFPGFIDEHIHGAGGADAMDATEEALCTVAKALAKEGTTAFLATTMTQSRENILKALANVAKVKKKGTGGAELLGVHLEGPFVCEKYAGAQPREYLMNPSVEAFEEFQKAAEGNIRMVTVAPELPGASELITYLRQKGVLVSVGHSAATYEQVVAARDLGADCITHTFNAQSPLHHRDVGVVGAALLKPALYTELIADYIHVSEPAVQLLVRTKPTDKVILITDSIRAKGLPEGTSELGGQTVTVKNGEARLADGTLAGSVLSMNEAIFNVGKNSFVPIAVTVGYATANPARHLRVYGERGSIEVGKRADFTVLNINNLAKYEVTLTVVGGEVVYQNDRPTLLGK